MMNAQWSTLGGVELITFGKTIVTHKLEQLGCTVAPPSSARDGRLAVRTPAGRSLEVFVSTQRIGGYVFWTKRRLQPSEHRFAVLVLLGQEREPSVYIVPSLDWIDASPPLTDRDYEGRKSEPEFGIEISASSVPSLRRYAWIGAQQKDTSPDPDRPTTAIMVSRRQGPPTRCCSSRHETASVKARVVRRPT